MTVSRETVQRIAALAALAVPDDDLDAIAGDLTAILDLIRQLGDAIDVDAPGHEPGRSAAPLREDTVTPSGLNAPPQEFAAEFAEGFFVAPRPPGVGSER